MKFDTFFLIGIICLLLFVLVSVIYTEHIQERDFDCCWILEYGTTCTSESRLQWVTGTRSEILGTKLHKSIGENNEWIVDGIRVCEER